MDYIYVLSSNGSELEDQYIFLDKDEAIHKLTAIYQSMSYEQFQKEYFHLERFHRKVTGEYSIEYTRYILDENGLVCLNEEAK